MFTKSRYRFSAQMMEIFLIISGLGLIGAEQRTGLLSVVQGHAGEQYQAEGADDTHPGRAARNEHEHDLGDDQHHQAPMRDGAGLEHVEFRGQREHGEHEEERRAQDQRATPMSEMLYTRKMELRVNPISAAYT